MTENKELTIVKKKQTIGDISLSTYTIPRDDLYITMKLEFYPQRKPLVGVCSFSTFFEPREGISTNSNKLIPDFQPLQFWFSKDTKLAMPLSVLCPEIQEAYAKLEKNVFGSRVSLDKTEFRICDCSGDEIFDLVKLTDEALLFSLMILEMKYPYQENSAFNYVISGLREIIFKNPEYKCLGDDSAAKQLVDMCINFLMINYTLSNKNLHGFIYDYLKITKNSGFDYYLMNYMHWNFLISHGSGIRCAWLDYEPLNWVISEECRESITNWILPENE